jgi:hypothetical protein
LPHALRIELFRAQKRNRLRKKVGGVSLYFTGEYSRFELSCGNSVLGIQLPGWAEIAVKRCIRGVKYEMTIAAFAQMPFDLTFDRRRQLPF